MTILSSPEVVAWLAQCRAEFVARASDKELLRSHVDEMMRVTDWKFGSDASCFQPIPYRSESNGFPPGRIYKKAYASPAEAKQKHAYSAGYSLGKLAFVIDPSRIANKWSFSRYEYRGEEILIENIEHFDDPKKGFLRLTSLFGLTWLRQHVERLEVGCGADARVAASLFQFNDGRLETEIRGASDWGSDERLQYCYDAQGNLSSVTIHHGKNGSPHVVWQAS